MAVRGIAFYDNQGQYFKSAEEASASDLAGVLGRVGDGDSLAPGIARIMLAKRAEIERIFAEHDQMQAIGQGSSNQPIVLREGIVTPLRQRA